MKQCRPVAEVTERMLTADKGFVLLSDIVRYGFHGVPTNGIQEVARSIRVSPTNKIDGWACSPRFTVRPMTIESKSISV